MHNNLLGQRDKGNVKRSRSQLVNCGIKKINRIHRDVRFKWPCYVYTCGLFKSRASTWFAVICASAKSTLCCILCFLSCRVSVLDKDKERLKMNLYIKCFVCNLECSYMYAMYLNVTILF